MKLINQIAMAKAKGDAAQVGVIALAWFIYGWKGAAVAFLGIGAYAVISYFVAREMMKVKS